VFSSGEAHLMGERARKNAQMGNFIFKLVGEKGQRLATARKTCIGRRLGNRKAGFSASLGSYEA